MIEMMNNYLLVRFIDNPLLIDLGNGLSLHKPARYMFEKDTGEGEKTAKVTDLRVTSPVICIVEASNPKYPQYSVGSKLFMHYMAFNSGEPQEHNGQSCAIVDAKNVLFKIEGDDLLPAENVFLGEYVEQPYTQTESGLYIPEVAQTFNKRRIKITHKAKVFANYIRGERYLTKQFDDYNVGDIVWAVDENQYELNYNSKKIVMLNSAYLMGKEEVYASA